MRRVLAIIGAVSLLCATLYLSWLNPIPVEFRITPTWTVGGQLGALMMFAFTAGGLLVLLAVSVQAGRRALLSWRSERRRRRNRRIDEWEERGEDLIWKGELQRGRALLHKAWQRRPEGTQALLALASSYRDTGELHRARGLLFDAANQRDADPEVLFGLALVHQAAGETGPCLDVLERIRALYPRAPRVLRSLRDLHESAGRWQEAVAMQEALLQEVREPQQLGHEREHLLALRYQAAVNRSAPETRRAALEMLAEGRALPLPVTVSLGDALRDGGRADEASVLWERALRGTPRTILYERLAAIATEPAHRQRLRAVLRKLRTDEVNGDSVRLWIAASYLGDDNTEAATRELDAVTDPARAPSLAHSLRGEVHRRRGELERAVEEFARAGFSPGYRCRECGADSAGWLGYCPSCRSWDSYRSAVEIARR